jgi:hypothetical protein
MNFSEVLTRMRRVTEHIALMMQGAPVGAWNLTTARHDLEEMLLWVCCCAPSRTLHKVAHVQCGERLQVSGFSGRPFDVRRVS